MKIIVRFAICTSLTFFAIGLTGCNSGKTREASADSNAITNAYAIKMKKGQTTPQNDKDFIEAMARNAHQIDRNIRGTKKADETKARAIRAAELGVTTTANPNF